MTRNALLLAASLRFAQDGYDHTSVRDIAADVGVNQALVYRYFGSKEALFEEASVQNQHLRELLECPLEDVPDLIVDHLFQRIFPMTAEVGAHPFLMLLQSAGNGSARTMFRDQIREDFSVHFAARLGGADAQLRAELLAAWVVGISFMRTVVEMPGLSAATADDLRTHFRRVVHGLLREPD